MAKKPKSKSPLPDKAGIIDFIAKNPGQSGKREIARAFNIKGAARIDLKRLLRQMADDGEIERRKRHVNIPGQLPPVSVIRVSGISDDGDLFCVPENLDGENDGLQIILSAKDAQRAPGPTPPGIGSRLLARLTRRPQTRGQPALYDARIIRTLGTLERRIIGVVQKNEDATARIEPIDKRQRKIIVLARSEADKVETGDLVEVELTGSSTGRSGPSRPAPARIVATFGKVEGANAASSIAIAAYELPHRFSSAALEQANGAKPATLKGREDLTALDLITIDPADARDRDDAVWARADNDPKNPGGHIVIVAIADVAHFVPVGSPLDTEAQTRGNSVYFPDQVVPMLPEILSNGLCSLNPGENRAAMAVEMIFDAKGHKRTHRFMSAMINTKAALSYAQAQAGIDGKADKATAHLLESALKPLWAAYGALKTARDARGPLELELPERKIKLGADGHIEDIIIPERLDAHRLIEEFMIQANVAAAHALDRAKYSLIYRVHEAPSIEKLRDLSTFLQTLNIRFSNTQLRIPGPLNTILAKVKGREIEPLVHQVMLRAQSQACYAVDNLGHFGLNLSHYAHFTSPIRRYADLCVHRALMAMLAGEKPDPQAHARLVAIAEHISMTERRAMSAERDTVDRLCAAFLSEQVGSRFAGRISGMTRGAIFIELDHTGADGIVPISSLAHDYFRYDEKRRAMTGQATGETHRLGDQVEVELLEAAPISGGLKFRLLSPGTPSRAQPKRSAKAKKSARKKSSRKRKARNKP